MPILSGTIRDVVAPSGGTITVQARSPRQESGGTAVVGTHVHTIAVPSSGVIPPTDIDPGPIALRVDFGSWKKTFLPVMPAHDVDLWTLLEAALPYEPAQITAFTALKTAAETARDESVAASESAGQSATNAAGSATAAAASAASVAGIADTVTTGRLSATNLNATYAPAFPATGITYDGSGNVQTVTENGIATTYTYNGDGTVATDTRVGVTRTYTYDGSGNLTGIAS